MTTDTKLAPTDAEIIALLGDRRYSTVGAVHEAITRWGRPAVAGEQVDRADAVNLARNTLTQHDRAITKKGVRVLAEAVLSMDSALTTPQPTQAQAEPKSGAKSFQTYGEANAYSKGYYAGKKAATQAQAGAVPLTDIRKAALDLYTPPFRHEYGYIRDANHQIVADDAGSEGTGLITSRIRGWGRIQYMDKPEQRAAALQDEVAEIIAEALNAYWSNHGIKGGQHVS